jgi:putative uncharacterized protein (fragment)
MVYNNQNYYFEKNLFGDVLRVYNSDEEEVAKFTYDSYGNILSQSGTMVDQVKIRYRGYYWDEETGFYYLQSRYYDPSICRFISSDQYELVGVLSASLGDLNLYSYCHNNPIMYSDASGNFPILATILGITAIVGMVLTGFGVGYDNNTLTAIGLTMVAIPALISGGMAVAAGIGGATLTGVVGGITVTAGVGTGLFASAEYQQAFTGNNWMLDAGMSEGWYNGLMLTTTIIATFGTLASSFCYSFNIKSITELGRYGKYGERGYRGIKFKTGSGKTRVLTFHTHSHIPRKSISQWHWQLQKWNPYANEVGSTIKRWIWWNLMGI